MKKETVKLNIEGEICPYPLILAIKKYEKIKDDLESGKKILEITSDHPTACENIPLRFKSMGFSVSVKKVGSSKWTITIKK